jgi:putative membrane protein
VTGDTPADRRLHPASLISRFLIRLPEFVLGLPAVTAVASDAGMKVILLMAAVGMVIAGISALLVWLRFSYGVGERDIVIQSGVFFRKRRVIPFDRIQDVDIERGPVARLFGAAKVKIETGGSAKDEGLLDLIGLEEAHQLRDHIRRARGDIGASQEEGFPGTEDEEPLLFQMPLGRVLLTGLFAFSLVYLAILFSLLQQAEPLIGIDPWDREWGALEPFVGALGDASWSITLILLFLLVFLGLLTALLRTLLRDYGFRLSRAEAGFRRRRGLFTLSEVVIPLRRVQAVIVRTGLIPRLFGWYRLEFQTLSGEARQGGSQQAAPLARLEEIVPILAELGLADLPPRETYKRVSGRLILRRMLPLILLSAAAALFGAVFFPPALFLPGVLPLALFGAYIRWRRHRYAFTPRACFIATGLFKDRLWIIPYEKLQTLQLSRSWLQRRLGLSTVRIDTAGASIMCQAAISDIEEADAAEAADRLLDAFYSTRATIRMAARSGTTG